MLPVLGIVVSLQHHFPHFHDWIVQLASSFGDGVSFSVGFICGPPVIFVGADPRVVEHVLKTNFSRYEKGPRFREIMFPFVGNGIFNTDGEAWRRQRKVGAHLFTSRALKEDMAAVFRCNCDRALQLLSLHAERGSSFDLQNVYFRFTLDTFAEVTFGETVGCLNGSAPEDVVAAPLPFALAFDVAQREIAARFYGPAWPLKRMLNIGSEKRLAAAIRTLDQCSRDIVQRAQLRHFTVKQLQQQMQKHSAVAINPQPGSTTGGADLLSRFIQYAEETVS
jgi:cytochrome P450